LKILITGGAGFLGSHLSDAFLARGDEVTILDVGGDLKVRHNLSNPRFHYVRDSVLNADILDGLILRSDLVYHLAAVVGVEHYVGDPYEVLNVNINGTQAVLKLAYKYNRKVVFSSTSEVYGTAQTDPMGEDHPLNPRSPYAAAKLAGEQFCQAFHHSLGFPTICLVFIKAFPPPTLRSRRQTLQAK
jgi:UDP-glucose 4-epimerase